MYLQEYILEAIRDELRLGLDYITNPNRSIRIINDKDVPAYSGEEFIGIYGASYTNEYDRLAISRKDTYEFIIGITRRMSGIPVDSTGETIYTQDESLISRNKSSMLNRAREIIQLLEYNWDIVGKIKSQASSDLIEVCILSPLALESSSPVEEVDASHFHLENDNDNPSGLLLELQFSGIESYVSKI